MKSNGKCSYSIQVLNSTFLAATNGPFLTKLISLMNVKKQKDK